MILIDYSGESAEPNTVWDELSQIPEFVCCCVSYRGLCDDCHPAYNLPRSRFVYPSGGIVVLVNCMSPTVANGQWARHHEQ